MAYACPIPFPADRYDQPLLDDGSRPARCSVPPEIATLLGFREYPCNLYHPKALRRSYVADLGISTPKQIAKRLVQFSNGHPELRPSSFIIPQVPGDTARSKTVHGVVESFLKSKITEEQPWAGF